MSVKSHRCSPVLVALLFGGALLSSSMASAQGDPAEDEGATGDLESEAMFGSDDGAAPDDVAPDDTAPADPAADPDDREVEPELETEDETYSQGAYDDAYGDEDDGYYQRDRGERGRADDDDGDRGRDRRDRKDRDDAAPADNAGAADGKNDRILMGGIITGLVVRFFPILLLDYILGPFAGQWAVNEFTDAPVEYRTSSKLAAAGAMFLFDVASFSAVGVVASIASLIGAWIAPAMSGICFLCSFGICAAAPLLGVGFVGMWVMEWLDADQPVTVSDAQDEPAPRRRRRRRSEIDVPGAPVVASVMSY